MSRKKITDKQSLKKQLQANHTAQRKKRQAATQINAVLQCKGRNDLQPPIPTLFKPVHSLYASPNRTRETTPGLLESIIRSIKKFGMVLPILIDSQNNVVAGHALWQAAIELGLEKIECRVIEHLDAAELEALSLALNRIGEIGKYSLEKLRERMIAIEGAGIELVSTGFTLPEISQIKLTPKVEDAEEAADICDIQSGTPTTSILGDLFHLGRHKLLCGDAAEGSSYDRLLTGTLAHLWFGDPPYNCKIKGFVGGLGKHQHPDFIQFSGKESRSEFHAFLKRCLDHGSASLMPGSVLFACMDWRNIDTLLEAGREAGLQRINIAVWHKGSGGMGGLYRSAHELVAVFCKDPVPRTNNIGLGVHGRDRTNVWTYPGANRQGSSAALALADHPSPKPIELVIDAILDVTNPGEIILDPFIGSGTTIIACEGCDRNAFGMEIDPRYIDRAITRWERLTGKTAIHVETGLTFAELTEQRSGQQTGGHHV